MYIDINTCNFPDGYQFDTFTDQTLNALKQLDTFYFLRKIHIYGDLKKYYELEECYLSTGETITNIIVTYFLQFLFFFLFWSDIFKLCFVIFFLYV